MLFASVSRVGARSPVLVVLLAVAGCIDQTAPPPPPAQPETATSSPPPSYPPIVTAEIGEPFWAANRTGDLALHVRFSFGAAEQCSLTYGTRSVPKQDGPTSMIFIQTPGSESISAMSRGRFFHAHAFEAVDTRGQSGWLGIQGEANISLEKDHSPLDLLLAVTDLGQLETSWHFAPGHDNATVYLGLTCGGTARAESVQVGKEAVLLDHRSMEGGLGAHAEFVGTVSYEDSLHQALSGPEVLLRGVALGQRGSLRTTLPEGEENVWEFGPVGLSTLNLTSGPGDFTFQLTTIGTGADWFLVCAVGVRPVDSLAGVEAALDGANETSGNA